MNFAASSATSPSTATVVVDGNHWRLTPADESFTPTTTTSGVGGDTSFKTATGTIYALTGTSPTLSLSAPTSVSERQ